MFSSKEHLHVIVEPDNEKRRKIYNWLEHEFIYFYTSVYLPDFEAKVRHRFQKCYGCDRCIKIKKGDYVQGQEENNIDEYYWLECDRCGDGFRYEPNYDGDPDKIIYQNNAIIIGGYVKGYQKKHCSPDTCLNPEIYEIHKIENPKGRQLSKQELSRYICDILKKKFEA